MKHKLTSLSFAVFFLLHSARAQQYKCDLADGTGRGYKVNGSEAHQCDDGTFCYQLGQGVYCGVGVGNTLASDCNSSPASGLSTGGLCSNEGSATCHQEDGKGPNYFRCVDGKAEQFACGGGSVCYQNGSGVFCGVPSDSSTCVPGAAKCGAADGRSADFTKCIGGESVSYTCGVGLTCYQEGPFHVSCGPYVANNTAIAHPCQPIAPTVDCS
ncbi:hypothetical protein DL89DRAFT_266760, partial [Linderina pennispora]